MKNITKIIDTSALVDNPHSIFTFENTNIIIPFPVLKELDSLKKNQDEVGRNARETVNLLDKLEGDLQKGVDLGKGSNLKVLDMNFNGCKTVDDKVIHITKDLMSKETVSLVSQDINMRVQAKSLGIIAESLNGNGSHNLSLDIYKGVEHVFFNDEDLTSINNRRSKGVCVDEYEEQYGPFFPNQFLVIDNDPSGYTAGIIKIKEGKKILLPIKDYKNAKGMECTPKNQEQNMAMNLMLDPDIHLTSLVGTAGTGKTLLALSAALTLHKEYGKTIVITKPTIPVGKDLGFLPGDVSAKMNPWMGSIFDNLSLLLPDKEYIKTMIEKEDIRIEPIQLFRGRSIPNSVIVVDEFQNCSKLETKTILTRSGKNTKIFFTADLNQIDTPYVDSRSNGATYCIEKLKQYDIIGHILLTKGERSPLSTLCSKVL